MSFLVSASFVDVHLSQGHRTSRKPNCWVHFLTNRSTNYDEVLYVANMHESNECHAAVYFIAFIFCSNMISYALNVQFVIISYSYLLERACM